MEGATVVEEKKRRPRYNRLNSLEEVRRNLARAIRQMELVNRPRRAKGQPRESAVAWEAEKDRLELDRGKALVYAYRTLAEMYQGVELERRLVELEKRLAQGAH